MAPVLTLIAGLVVGALAGWWWRGRSIASQPATESADAPASSAVAPAQSAAPAQESDTETESRAADRVPALVGAPAEGTAVPGPSPVPAAETITAPAADKTEPVADKTQAAAEKTEPVAGKTEPVAAAPVADVAEPVSADPVSAEPVSAEPKLEVVEDTIVVVAEPIDEETVVVVAEETIVVAEPVVTGTAATPGVDDTEPVTEATPVPDVEQIVAEPQDLTKIAGIGPKMAMALAASGITTFAQLADTSVEDIRKAIAAAGMRLAPSVPTWPEQARRFM